MSLTPLELGVDGTGYAMEMLGLVRIVGALVAVLWLPGYAALRLLGIRQGNPEYWAMPIGLSIAINALLAQWLDTLKVRLSSPVLALLFAALATIVCLVEITTLRYTRRQSGRPPTTERDALYMRDEIDGAERQRPTARMSLFGVPPRALFAVSLFLVAATTLTLRYLQASDLVLPAWVDGLHNVYIVQTILEEGKLPESLALYGTPFYYHFGFHVSTAIFASITGMVSERAVLVFGQTLNALIVVGVFGLAQRLTQRRRTALAAAMLTAGFSRFPAEFVASSRFTFVTGILLLSITLASLWDVSHRPSCRNACVLGLLTAGLVLTHYVIAVYLFCFVLVWLAHCLRKWTSRNREHLFRSLSAIGLGLLSVVLLDAAWIWRIAPYILGKVGARTDYAAQDLWRPFRERIAHLWRFVNNPVDITILLFALVASVLILRRKQTISILVYWVGLLTLVNQQLFWDFQPFTMSRVVAASSLPVNILAAEGLYQTTRWLFSSKVRESNIFKGIYTSVFCGLGVLIATTRIDIVPDDVIFATAADTAAMTWIADNVSVDSRFLINTVLWSGSIYRGTDGGWWLPLITGHRTTLPPGIGYAWNAESVKKTAIQVMALDGCTEEFWKLVLDQGITHIYVGNTHRGPLHRVYWPACEGIEEIYRIKGVQVYQITEEAQSQW